MTIATTRPPRCSRCRFPGRYSPVLSLPMPDGSAYLLRVRLRLCSAHAIPDPDRMVTPLDVQDVARAFARMGYTAPPLGRWVVSFDPPPAPNPYPRPPSRATA